jgi:hypothetical protein
MFQTWPPTSKRRATGTGDCRDSHRTAPPFQNKQQHHPERKGAPTRAKPSGSGGKSEHDAPPRKSERAHVCTPIGSVSGGQRRRGAANKRVRYSSHQQNLVTWELRTQKHVVRCQWLAAARDLPLSCGVPAGESRSSAARLAATVTGLAFLLHTAPALAAAGEPGGSVRMGDSHETEQRRPSCREGHELQTDRERLAEPGSQPRLRARAPRRSSPQSGYYTRRSA